MGRLIGTLLSGWVFVSFGFAACLVVSSLFILCATIISWRLPTSTASNVNVINS